MIKLYTIIICLLINCGITIAQKSNIFNVPLVVDPKVCPSKRLFAVDTIINARLDTLSRIGLWQKPSGKIVELRLKEGFQTELSNLIFATLPNFDNKLPWYSLLIHEFDINSAPDNTRFELAVTFCEHKNALKIDSSAANSLNNTQKLVPVYKVDIIVESSTNSFEELIKQGLTKVFLKFNDYLANPNTVPSIYSDFAIEAAKAAQDLNLTQTAYTSTYTNEDNLLGCNKLRSGIYQSFNELRQNRPSLTGALMVQVKNNFATLRKPSGSRAKHRFFGFSDGKNLFISTGLYQTTGFIRRYAKIQSVGRYLLWIDNYLTTAEMAANLAGATFGLIGALATSSANSYKDCIALDMQTGGVFMVTKDKLSQMLAGHDDLLAELAAMTNLKDEQQQFYLLDKLNQRSRALVTR